MIPISKVPKQQVSSAIMEKRKRDREKERSKLAPKKKYPPDAKTRFGKQFQMKLCELFISDDPAAIDQLRAMHDEAVAYYNEHELNEMWLSDEENDCKQMKAPVSKKMHQDSKAEVRASGASRKTSAEEKEKTKTKPATATPVASTAPVISSISNVELSDDSDEEPAKKLSITHSKTIKLCDVCSDGTSAGTNALLECEECGKSVHQKCNRPEVSTIQARDPRFLFVCYNCKDRESKAEKNCNGNNDNGGTSKASTSSTAKKDEKMSAQKSTSDISATWASFAAKKLKKPAVTPGYGSLSNSSAFQRSTGLNNPAPKSFPSFSKK